MILDLFDVLEAIFYQKRYKDKHSLEERAKEANKILKIAICIFRTWSFCTENCHDRFIGK
jgi:hypothetical protein